MASTAMYDFLDKSTADYKTVFSTAILPQHILTEVGEKNVIVHMGDDGSEERISLDNDPIYRVRLRWDYLSEAHAATILSHYHSTGMANGMARSWRWKHPTDTHTYTVRYDSPLNRGIMPRGGDGQIHQVSEITLRILGQAT